MSKEPFESRIFGKAMAEQLGLDPSRVTLVTIEGRNGTQLTAQVTVAINADDLAAVAGRMKTSRAAVAGVCDHHPKEPT